MKILIGSIMHESNTFAPTVTDIEVFKRTQYLTGDDIIKYHLNQRSEVGGVLQVLKKKGVSVIPTISAWAMPYGKVAGKTYSILKNSLLSGIKENIRELDGVLLCLHGDRPGWSRGLGETQGPAPERPANTGRAAPYIPIGGCGDRAVPQAGR